MASRTGAALVGVGFLLAAGGAGAYLLWRGGEPAPIVGVVRATEVRVAPEVGGQLAAIKVTKGERVKAGEVVAQLSALELTASVAQARAALAAAVADRDHVYAGVRAEEVAALAAEIAKAKSKLDYAQAQLARISYLATTIRAPVDGVVSVIVAEVGENISAGEPVLAIEAAGEQWLSFNAREDFLRGITVGTTVEVGRTGTRERIPALVTELIPLGPFATWQAERAVGDHDRNTLRLRLDPQRDAAKFEPGMTVRLAR